MRTQNPHSIRVSRTIGGTTKADRWCDDRHSEYPTPCPRVIKRGEQYVRAVMFKNHDVYSWVDRDTHRPLTRPMVTNMCFACASQYHTTGLLVIDAERAARGGAA